MGKEFVDFDDVEAIEYSGNELDLTDDLVEALRLLEAAAGILTVNIQPGVINDRWVAHKWGEVAANAGIPLNDARLLANCDCDYDVANAYENFQIEHGYNPEDCLILTGCPF